MPKPKIYLFIAILLSVTLAVLSAWRLPAIFGLRTNGAVWLGIGLFLALFWSGAGYLCYRFGRKLTRQQWLTVSIGIVIFGLLGLLLMTPAGLSRATIAIYAKNVWAPDIFTALWTEGDQQPYVSLKLPTGQMVSTSVEISPHQDSLGEIWLLKATRADGRDIPLEQFKGEGNWKLHTVDWGGETNRPAWVLPQGEQPAVLRWQGQAEGPLTLLFLKHPFAGQVIVRLNGQEQTVDLHSPSYAFQGVTLPLSVWRASVPYSALQTRRIGFVAEADPAGHLPLLLEKIEITGVSGVTQAFTGPQLLEILRVKYADPSLTPAGVSLISNTDETPKFTLVVPETGDLGWGRAVSWLENVLLVLYLVIIGVIVAVILTRWLPSRFLTNLNLAAITLIVALIGGEIGLRLYLPAADKYYVWPPKLHVVFKPAPEVFPGLEGESHFITNSEGIRGDEFSKDDDYRILAIGGSTTESLYLDQREAWPYLLQEQLNNANRNLKVWVGNVGKSGHSTREHVLQMEYLLAQYPQIDAVIMLIGANDFSLRLNGQPPFDPNYLDSPNKHLQQINRAFAVLPTWNPNQPYYTYTATWRLVDKIWQARVKANTVADIDVEDGLGWNYVERRNYRKNAQFSSDLPDLSGGLAEYEANINYLINLAGVYDVRLILMTQPSLWRTDLTPAEEDLLWAGYGPDRRFFYTVKALIAGINTYNDKLLEICTRQQVECIDLAGAIPKDATVFYDDMHFNESGAMQVAEVVTDYLLNLGPFTLPQTTEGLVEP